jgi:hypothetical protein
LAGLPGRAGVVECLLNMVTCSFSCVSLCSRPAAVIGRPLFTAFYYSGVEEGAKVSSKLGGKSQKSNKDKCLGA